MARKMTPEEEQDQCISAYSLRFGRKDDRSDVPGEQREARLAAAVQCAEQWHTFTPNTLIKGWSEHFHYGPFAPREPIQQGLVFYEHRLALLMGLKPGMKVLDVGCGVGAPAREIAKLVGCEIVGISINQNHIDKAIEMTAQAGLSHLCTFVRGDFMDLPFAPSSFDAAYGIEATVHATSLSQVYTNIAHVLKPNAPFGLSEWVMTPKFDANNPKHIDIRHRLERGGGIGNLQTAQNARLAMKSAGFDIILDEDYSVHWDTTLRFHPQQDPNITTNPPTTSPSPIIIPFLTGPAQAPPPSAPITLTKPTSPPSASPRPWYYPLQGNTRLAATHTDYWTAWKMSPIPRKSSYWLAWTLEKVGIYPKGVVGAMDTIRECVDGSVQGGASGIFSPCWWFIGVKREGTGVEGRVA